ncbi:MAG TPA: SpoIIE family protein phosphatase, partial [Acidimicrobiia bacterium]|nr:SpoIIE family protein phosphatase [Acidimicrobiia bacterium]
ALGVDSDVDIDLYSLDVGPGDRVILCSDGLTTMVRDRDLERIARSDRDAQHTAEALVDEANAAGGEDNITVIVIDVVEVGPQVAPDPVALAEAAAPAPAPAPPPPAPEPKTRASRAGLWRTIAVTIVPLLLIAALAAAALGWYARRSYYVGVAGSEVVVYKGVPGGVLGWDPTIDERTGIQVADLAPVDRERVMTNTSRGSLSTARAYVSRLRSGTTTSTASTTTTRPPRRTTTTRHR